MILQMSHFLLYLVNVIKQQVKEVLTVIYWCWWWDDNGNCSNDMYFFDIVQ